MEYSKESNLEKREITELENLKERLEPYRNWAATLSDDEIYKKLNSHRDVGDFFSDKLTGSEIVEALVGWGVPVIGDAASLVVTSGLALTSRTSPRAIARMYASALKDGLVGALATLAGPIDPLVDLLVVRSITQNTNVLLEVYYCMIDDLYRRGNEAIDYGDQDKARNYFEKADKYKATYHEMCLRLSKRTLGVGRKRISSINEDISGRASNVLE